MATLTEKNIQEFKERGFTQARNGYLREDNCSVFEQDDAYFVHKCSFKEETKIIMSLDFQSLAECLVTSSQAR